MITDTLRTLRVAAPTQKREEPVSGAVDEHLLASLVRQGLKREQLVTDVPVSYTHLTLPTILRV